MISELLLELETSSLCQVRPTMCWPNCLVLAALTPTFTLEFETQVARHLAEFKDQKYGYPHGYPQCPSIPLFLPSSPNHFFSSILSLPWSGPSCPPGLCRATCQRAPAAADGCWQGSHPPEQHQISIRCEVFITKPDTFITKSISEDEKAAEFQIKEGFIEANNSAHCSLSLHQSVSLDLQTLSYKRWKLLLSDDTRCLLQ